MKRVPVLPTIIVLLAVATMIGLGIWQIQRLHWKEALLADYASAATKPPIAWPMPADPDALPLYRKSSVNCVSVEGWRASSGRNRAGAAGWVHIAACRTGAEGPGAQVVAGWSQRPENPQWAGGLVTGVIAPDSRFLVRLVADPPVAGLAATQPPSLDDIPNNHFAYAVQWFLFAGIALVIYVLALRRRTGER